MAEDIPQDRIPSGGQRQTPYVEGYLEELLDKQEMSHVPPQTGELYLVVAVSHPCNAGSEPWTTPQDMAVVSVMILAIMIVRCENLP